MENNFEKLMIWQQWDSAIEETIRKMETQAQEKPVREDAVITEEQRNTTPQPTFHLFVHLPIELRAMIWKHLIPGERLVPIRYHRETCSYTSRMLPPTILQINVESRAYAQKIYKEITLGSQTVVGAYMDLSRDTLYFCSDVGWLCEQQINSEVPLEFDKYKWSEHVSMIWDDILKHPDTAVLTKKIVTCGQSSGTLMWYLIKRRSNLSVPIEEWVVMSEGGTGALSNENLKEDPMMRGWHPHDKKLLEETEITIERIKRWDARHGKPVTVDFKLKYWHWSRRR